MKKSFLHTLHGVAGLIAGVFVLLMSVSGSVLVFHEQMDQVQWPAFTVKEGVPLLPIDSIYKAVQKNYPHAKISNGYGAGSVNELFLITVYDSSYRNGEKGLQVLLHPQTAAVLGNHGGSEDFSGNPMAWLSRFHSSFHLNKPGEWLLGVFGSVFLVSIITGLILYRKDILPVLLFRKSAWQRSSLHPLIGTWALLFNLLIAGSGVWMQRYVFKPDFYKSWPAFKAERKASPPLRFNLDSALQAVQHANGFTPYVYYFSGKPGGTTAVYGSRPGNGFIHNKKFADAVFLDSTGTISRTAFVNEIPKEDRRDIINAQLHYGRWGGWPVQLLYSLFGLSGGLLSITGALLWFRRRKQHGDAYQIQ
jgi:uncharacterized iron-regulated membrane protein